MPNELFFKELRQLIAKNELAKAFAELQSFLEDSPKLDETVLQSARHIDILEQIRKGIVNEEQANVTKNRIRTSLLDLVRELENHQILEVQQASVYKQITKKIQDNRGAGTEEVLNHKTIEDLDAKELARLFEQDRVLQMFDDAEILPKDLTPQQKLRQLSLAENGHIFKGSFLCFGISYQIFSVCHTAIEAKFIQFKGTERHSILVLKALQGNLISQYEKMILLLLTHIPAARDRVNNEDIYEIPMLAVREFIANAFIHRSYSNDTRTYIQVELFDNRLEIKSPGQLPESVNVKNITGMVLVNPVIAAVFHLYKYVERAGTGIQVAQEALKNHGLKPARIENMQQPKMVRVTIFRKKNTELGQHRKGLWGRILEGVRHVFS